MPVCRRPVDLPIRFPEQRRVKLSRYVVTRRVPPRAANDNRRPWATQAWQWGLALGAVPTLTGLLLLSGMF